MSSSPNKTWNARVEFSPSVIDRARKLYDSGAVAVGSAGSYTVDSDSGSTYRVTMDAEEVRDGLISWVSCTCRHGRSAKGRARCSHVVAVLMYLRDVRAWQLRPVN